MGFPRAYRLIPFIFTLLFPLLAFTEELYDPLAVYLTWQQKPDTTITIQWISTDEIKANLIEYHSETEDFWHSVEGSYSAMPGAYNFLVHRVELSNLQPFTDYYFRAGPHGKTYKFRTMPSDISNPIRFVVGGDVYHDNLDTVIATNKQAAKTSPMFALVGGDLAYGADRFGILSEKWQSWINWAIAGVELKQETRTRWIEWLSCWKETMITPEGRLIPMVPAIGNHDVNGGFNKTPEDAICFHTFFPFPENKGYGVLDFNNYLSIVVLNTNHTASIKGKQTKWLQETLRSRTEVPHVFALYHVSAYPSVRKYKNKTAQSIRNFWVPLFDKYNITAAFEHHDHAYKRTHPLRGNKVDPSGILYLGDGAWGPAEARQPNANLWYLAKSAAKRHFFLVTLQGNKRDFAAIDPSGEIFDQFSIEAKAKN